MTERLYWPLPFGEGGKLFRAAMYRAEQYAQDDNLNPSYEMVQELVQSQKENGLGSASVEEAFAIAMSYLGRLRAKEEIPPLEPDLYR